MTTSSESFTRPPRNTIARGDIYTSIFALSHAFKDGEYNDIPTILVTLEKHKPLIIEATTDLEVFKLYHRTLIAGIEHSKELFSQRFTDIALWYSMQMLPQINEKLNDMYLDNENANNKVMILEIITQYDKMLKYTPENKTQEREEIYKLLSRYITHCYPDSIAKQLLDQFYLKKEAIDILTEQINLDLASDDPDRYHKIGTILSRIMTWEYENTPPKKIKNFYKENKFYLKIESLMEKLLKKYNLDPKELFHIWKSNHEESPYINIRFWVLRNFESIISLEDKCPGICNTLRDEFGIRNFARYPEELLIKQYEQRNDTESPYYVDVKASSDYNDAIANVYNIEAKETNLPLTRYIEANGKLDLAKRFIYLNRKYNPENREDKKIAFGLIQAHGSPTGMALGKSTERTNDLSINDLTGPVAKQILGFFQKNATIILVSCSTGRENPIIKTFFPKWIRSIGRKISAMRPGIEIIASDKDSHLEHIHMRTYEGRPVFSVIFGSGEIKFEGTHFMNGEIDDTNYFNFIKRAKYY